MKKTKTTAIVEPISTATTKFDIKSYLTTKNIIIALVVLLILSISSGLYFYNKATEDPQKVVDKKIQETISAVGKLMVLPANETPTIATVTAPEQLKGQVFFINAHKGDQLLIYKNAQKAILYNPSINKIIEVSPYTPSQPQQ